MTLEKGTEGQFVPSDVSTVLGDQEWIHILGELSLEFVPAPELIEVNNFDSNEATVTLLAEIVPEDESSDDALVEALERVESMKPEEDDSDDELVALLDRVESVIQPEAMGESLYPEEETQVSKPKSTIQIQRLYEC